MNRTLHIFYRHVPQTADARSRDPNKSRPEWFSYEACWRNLLHTIQQDPLGPRVEVTVMFDGSQDEYGTDFVSKYIGFDDTRIKVQPIIAGSDRYSAMITAQFAFEYSAEPSDIYYFLENDYLHCSGWVSKAFELCESKEDADYWSLYDHGDKYFLPMYAELTAKIFHTNTHHWRTAPSTCGSFMVRKSTYDADFDLLRLGLPDYEFFNKLVNERSRKILTPIPGLATHCMTGYLSPVIQWERIISQYGT